MLLSKKLSTVKQTIKRILAYKCYSGDQTQRNTRKKRNANGLLVWKNVGKRPLGRPRSR
jgi:hypothetical protein